MQHVESGTGATRGGTAMGGDAGQAVAMCAEVAEGVSGLLADMSEGIHGVTPAKLCALSAALGRVTSLLDSVSERLWGAGCHDSAQRAPWAPAGGSAPARPAATQDARHARAVQGAENFRRSARRFREVQEGR